jgi:hypothetical protein
MLISKVLVFDLNHVRTVDSPRLKHGREAFCYWSILIENYFLKQVLYGFIFKILFRLGLMNAFLRKV